MKTDIPAAVTVWAGRFMEMARTFAVVAKGMLLFTALMLGLAGCCWCIGAFALRSFGRTPYWILNAVTAIPVLGAAFFAFAFQRATKLPGLIDANMARIQALLKNDLPELVAGNQDGKPAGRWQRFVTTARIMRKVYKVTADARDGWATTASAVAMAAPAFWILYGIAMVSCAVMSLAIVIAALVMLVA